MLAELVTSVTTETLLRWQRKLIVNKYDGSTRRRPGRAAMAKDIEELVIRTATENRAWSICAHRVRDVELGHELARNIIANILKRNAISLLPKEFGKSPGKSFSPNTGTRLLQPTSLPWRSGPERDFSDS